MRKISFIENPGAGYDWEVKRSFSPETWVKIVQAAGFQNSGWSTLELPAEEKSQNPYYHCESSKPS